MAFGKRPFISAAVVIVGVAAALCLAGGEEDTTSLEGKVAPEVALRTNLGKQFKLSDFKGNVVLMDYWATWCGPCRESLPNINELANDKELFGKGLRVVAINDEEANGEVNQFVKANDYTFIVPMDTAGKFGRDYKVQGIPTTVVVGRDGKIVKAFVGFGDAVDAGLKVAINTALEAEPPAKTPKGPKKK